MVNTFLPYADFEQCAKCLDNKRLYKQIVECKQIIKAIEANNNNEKYGFQNHPIVQMWQNYPYHLKKYMACMFKEWFRRRWSKELMLNGIFPNPDFALEPPKPHWLGLPELHASHRSNLLRKDIKHYSQFGWIEPNDLEYVWCAP